MVAHPLRSGSWSCYGKDLPLRLAERLGEPRGSISYRVSQLPKARSYALAVVFRNAVYVVGGSRTPGDSHAARGTRIVDRLTG